MKVMVAAGCVLLAGCGIGWAAPHRADPHPRAEAANAAAGWSAPQCGREPSPPQVDTATVQRYNASVDQVTAYDQAARAYNSCVSREATAQQTAISDAARARIDAIQAVSVGVQKRIAANFTGLEAALRRGMPKGAGK